MAYRGIDKIVSMTNDLVEENNAINAMKAEIEKIENLNEYNEAVITLNKRVDEYNERRRELTKMIKGEI